METILERVNLNRAFKEVVANKGSAGVDGMGVKDLRAHLRSNGAELVWDIKEGRYKPSPVRRVFIPKENGQKRPLGIPTVVDRFVQQAVARVLSMQYEEVFSNGSKVKFKDIVQNNSLFLAVHLVIIQINNF